MRDSEMVEIECPHCGERIEVCVDVSDAGDEWIEDCSVCCRPITIRLGPADGDQPVVTDVSSAD